MALSNETLFVNCKQIILGINDHKNRSERVTIENKPKSVSVRKAPNKNFLSKITKFELLSRGITKIDDLISSSSQSDISSCSIKLDLNEEKMLRQNLSKKEFLKIREIRSKSFGCEKELHLKRKQKKSQVKSSAKNEVKIDSSKKPFNLEESLNYIDDDISHSNENRESNTNDSDDSDDNVIYEGDSADELNDFLEEDDFENFDSSDTDSDEILKCRSAPISPTRNLNKQESDKKSTTNNNCASFIYNVNLYNDQHNLVILNTQDEFKRNLKNLKKIEKNSSSSTDSCSSESSLNSHLEPLVINEENSINLTTSSNKITVIPFVKNSQTDLNILCSTSSSSSSSSSKDMNSQQLEIDKALSPSSSSESSCNEQEDKIEEILKTDDSASLTDDNSQSSSSNLLSESQYFLKDNYEKAKREREIEQQLAEMEKKRLQEILDICLEFQKQEQGKLNAVNNIEKIQNSSTVSSLSSNQSQNQQIIISELPSLNTILNSANNKDKISPSSTNRNSTNSITPSKDIIIEFQQQQQQQQQPQQLQNNKNQQCQQQTKNHIDKLTKEKCELISSLNSIKQKIKDIEMRQSEALRDLEMERALLDVEQTSELKLIQSEENKLKHLHQEHQLKLEAFNIHTNQIRNEIKIVQMTIKNIENEILILDTTLDTNFFLSTGNCLDLDWENLKNQKEHALEEARRAHEDLEFQLMELEAKYETELEDIQTRLIKEQEILIESFKQKQHNLTTFDHEQQKIILQIKSETEILELERLNLIEQFKKHRNQLESIEKKLQKIGDYQSLDVNLDNQENVSQEDSPSPASSSVSLSSATNSSETNPSSSVNQPRYVYPSILPQILQCSLNQNKTNNYKKHLSQSFRDILENTMLINGISEANNRNYINLNPNYSKNQRLSINKSLGSLNNQTTVIAANVSCLTGSVNNQSKMNSSQQHLLMEQNMDEFIDDLEKKLSSPISNQLAIKFANLERSLAMSKAENNNLLEQQYQARERELFLLQEEKRKREDLERQLNEEKNLRLKICEENIKLRDKKQTQARPLTRYLPVRDNNFDLKLHVENSGHNLLNQIDPNTKQPLIYINSNSCRGYLLKMGQKFKTWNKRWFVFDRNKRTLCYYLDKHETKLRGSIYFQSINEVYVDHMRTIKTPDSKSTFVVKTIDRNFYLVAPSSELMRIWIDVIFTGAEGYLEFFE
ncbi:unnamed protein product [Brachionus calyciflorus]|uniref:PH domain-containing protein n=1 Tax=Brachionus calyciflorus TaxID=104777 RepID=A0A813MNH6_9BILA|nr:unnamed protein product [Brachionus calyciflorus]